jgi:P-type Cu2+ transporter
MTAATFSQALDIDPTPFVRRDAKGASRLELAVKGMRCAGCIAKIERGMQTLPGVEEARVNLSTAKLSVRWREGRTTAAAIVARINELGFQAFPYDPASLLNHDEAEGRFLLRCLAVAGFAASNVMFLSICIWAGLDGEMGQGTRTLLYWISGLIAVPAALYAGRPFFLSALASLSAGRANMDVPITLGILLALGLSVAEALQGGEHAYFDAAVSLPFLLLIGRYLDHLLRRKARETAFDLAAMQTVTATRIEPDGHTTPVAARDIAPGDKLLLAAGDRTPVDAIVETGESEADVSLVTGESAPVTVKPGEVLRAGSVVLGHPLTVRATALVQDSLVAEMARLLEAGQQSRGRYVRWADRAAALYVPAVHGLALAVLAGGLMAGEPIRAALTNAIALLIITCPCALGLAVPAVQIVATSRLFRAGLLVKSGDALERLAEIDTAVFDKTGTLTFGRPILKNKDDIAPRDMALAASLARASKHPLSRALAAIAPAGGIIEGTRATPGEGLEARMDGVHLRLGRAQWVAAVPAADGDASHLWFRRDDETPVRFDFEDRLRPDAARTVSDLRQLGLNVEMLSGDRLAPAQAVAAEAGLTTWRAATDPKQKADYLESLRMQGRRVLMIGDGLNDAPALALAHVSISPAAAAHASQSAADIIIQADALAPIAQAIVVARAARNLVFQNFAFAAVYNVVAVPLAAFGQVTPLIAAVAMSASSLIVMLNALRLAQRS